MQDLYQNLHQLINFRHTLTNEPRPMDFHQHQDQYEIYFFLTGDVHYFIEKQVYHLQYGDLLIMHSNELHRPNFQSKKQRYENCVIHFNPALLANLNSSQFDLLHCFNNRKFGEQNRMRLNPQQIDDFLKIFERMELYTRPQALPGSDILFVAAFTELLVFINRIFLNQGKQDDQVMIPDKLSSLFTYIDENLDQDLSLEVLEHVVFMNRSYLCRLFKKHTGSTIHEHILFKRINKAKQLLREGSTVTDTCQLAGFNDYSNFIRTFKKAVGLPPRQYQAQQRRG
ncbi:MULTISPECIES: AraC family transcriptional regulator [Paenibacillus]|uniref:AraC family transcriptional regulator n=1 Tax=Paenibacillus violae TaxID=3077234 RepID=A0ABU3REX1_9BACL|nr:MULTISPECIES: AraC family transcriptional regulator [Paenibacillus]MDU0202840.1 AraC family transcriptional regulator [Paenibacillus sp. PFR10]MEC0266638.1 AraC family transcriptional regulator [Paenibacillus anseongense]